MVSPQPLTTPLTVVGSKEASGKQIGFTLSPVKSNGESNFKIARSKSNALTLSLYQDVRNYQIYIYRNKDKGIWFLSSRV